MRWANDRIALGFAPPIENLEADYSAPTDIIVLYQSGFKCIGSIGTSRKREVIVSPDESSYVPQGVDNYCQTDRSAELLYVSFDQELRKQFQDEVGANHDFDLDSMQGRRVPNHKALSRMLLQFLASDGFGGEMKANSLVSLIMSDFLQEAERSQTSEDKLALGREKIRLVTTYIAENSDDELSLQKMADMVGVSAFHFSKMFKLETGLPPHQFVLQHRIDRAKQLLADKNRSIAEIAYEVGFSSQSHMTETFRRLLGTTPGRYRSIILS